MQILAKDIKDRINDTPFCKNIGIRVLDIDKGYAKLEMPYKMDLTQPLGFIHGGAIASLVDSAGAFASFTVIKEDELVYTVELKVSYLVGIKEGPIIAEAKVISPGDRIIVTDIDVLNSSRELLAKAIATYIKYKNNF